MTQNHGDTETAAREALIRSGRQMANALYNLSYKIPVDQAEQVRPVIAEWDTALRALAALRPASPGEVTVTEAIQKHPDYERVRKIWDDALKISEGHCRDLDEKLEQETERVVEYSNRISVLLSEKADLTAALSARPTAPDAVAAETEA